MIIEICTKKDKNGHRKMLNIGTIEKEYERDFSCNWYHNGYITVSNRDFDKILTILKQLGYVEVT